MANHYITWQTDLNASMDDVSVTETDASTTFPSGFAANKTVMIVVNRDVLGTNAESAMRAAVLEAIERIEKRIEESKFLN